MIAVFGAEGTFLAEFDGGRTLKSGPDVETVQREEEHDEIMDLWDRIFEEEARVVNKMEIKRGVVRAGLHQLRNKAGTGNIRNEQTSISEYPPVIKFE